jgi:hypothetical protein
VNPYVKAGGWRPRTASAAQVAEAAASNPYVKAGGWRPRTASAAQVAEAAAVNPYVKAGGWRPRTAARQQEPEGLNPIVSASQQASKYVRAGRGGPTVAQGQAE